MDIEKDSTKADKPAEAQLTARTHSGGGSVVEEAGDALRDIADNKKSSLAGQLDGLASALDSSADEFDENTSLPVGEFAHRAARTIRSSSKRLRNTDSESLFDSLIDMARARPYATAACTAVAGYAFARYLRSTAGSGMTSRNNSRTQQWSRHNGQG